jgi:hypothetical protein
MIAWAAFVLWQFHVLRRADVKALFLRKRRSPPGSAFKPAEWQFSLSTLLLVMLVCTLVFWRLSDSDLVYDRRMTGRSFNTEREVFVVWYTYRNHKFLPRPPVLDLVLFQVWQGNDPELPSDVHDHAATMSFLNERVVTKPDGTEIRVPRRVPIVELIDGEYRERWERVTYTQLEAFLNSPSDAYTFDELLKFIEQNPKID